MKWIAALLCLVCLLSFSSCADKEFSLDNTLVEQGGDLKLDLLNKNDEGKIASERLENILEAIKNQDCTAIHVMFSPVVQESATDLEDGEAYLLSLVVGDVTSWEKIGGSVDESKDSFSNTKISKYRFYVYTEEQKILFVITECLKDFESPENVGLYSIKAIDTASMDEEPTFSDAGIFIKG